MSNSKCKNTESSFEAQVMRPTIKFFYFLNKLGKTPSNKSANSPETIESDFSIERIGNLPGNWNVINPKKNIER